MVGGCCLRCYTLHFCSAFGELVNDPYPQLFCIVATFDWYTLCHASCLPSDYCSICQRIICRLYPPFSYSFMPVNFLFSVSASCVPLVTHVHAFPRFSSLETPLFTLCKRLATSLDVMVRVLFVGFPCVVIPTQCNYHGSSLWSSNHYLLLY